jgi:hypothetical protein
MARASLPSRSKPCTRGWRVWFELANLCNQYPVRPGAGLQPAERHQDKGRFGGVQALSNRLTVEVSRQRVGSFLFGSRMERWKWWAELARWRDGVGKIDLSCPVCWVLSAQCPSANREGGSSLDVGLMAQLEGESCPLTVIGKPGPYRSSELRPVK